MPPVLRTHTALLLSLLPLPPLLSLLPLVAAMPMHDVNPTLSLPSLTRVATFGDVAHTFDSQYNFSTSCPQRVSIKRISVDNRRNIGTVALGAIVHDNATCRGVGTSSMRLVSEATVKQPGLLQRLGFPRAAAGLQRNRAALATVQNAKTDSSLLVGFDEGERRCGNSVYPDATFYFFIREPTMFKITITTGIGTRTSIAIPPNKRSLFITGPDNILCLLTDATTGSGRQVITTTTPPGISEPPIPSASPSPTASPSASPIPPPITVSSSPSPASTSLITPITNITIPSPTPPTPLSTPSTTPTSDTGATPNTQPLQPNSTTNGGTVCFPSSATVQLVSGAQIPISSLRIGDRVRTGPQTYSDVFFFTHRLPAIHSTFVRLTTASGAAVTLTASHYLHVDHTLRAAGAVRVGHTLHLADGRVSRVTAITHVTANGLYNPQTVDGNLVVDGILTSTYTTAVHPHLAHGPLLAPLRLLYACTSAAAPALDRFARLIDAAAPGLARLLPAGPSSVV